MVNPDSIESITIVGCGEIGLLAGLYFRREFSDASIEIIGDFTSGSNQLGKSTNHAVFRLLHDSLGFGKREFLEETGSVYKLGAQFYDWFEEDLFMPFGSQSPEPGTEAQYMYENGLLPTVNEVCLADGFAPVSDTTPRSDGPIHCLNHLAYHFDSARLNTFLQDKCRERGVELYDDYVNEVDISDGKIVEIRGSQGTHSADLYVDASGFSRAIIGEFNVSTVELPLLVDKALVGTRDLPVEEIYPATVHRGLDAGWMWQIDTIGERDVGYVFSSDHINVSTALDEIVCETTGFSTDDFREYSFTGEYLTSPWVGNCVAFGNSAGFAEPLQAYATVIHMLEIEVFLSMLRRITGEAKPGHRNDFNQHYSEFWTSVTDFILLHYKQAAQNSRFWKDQAAQSFSNDYKLLEYYHRYGFSVPASVRRHIRNGVGQEFGLTAMYLMGIEAQCFEKTDYNVSIEGNPYQQHHDNIQQTKTQLIDQDEFYRYVNRAVGGD